MLYCRNALIFKFFSAFLVIHPLLLPVPRGRGGGDRWVSLCLVVLLPVPLSPEIQGTLVIFLCNCMSWLVARDFPSFPWNSFINQNMEEH